MLHTRPFRRRRLIALAGVAALGVPAARAAELQKLAILTPEEPTDFGWNQQGYDAAKAVAAKYHLAFLPATGLGYGDVRATLRELAQDGAGLMIAHASGYNTAAPEIAAETKVPVAVVDRPDADQPGLVADYTLSGKDGAYLAGRLAAKTTQTGTVGIVVSGEPPAWNSQSAGFAQGVRAERADVKVLYAVIGPAAYADAAGGKRVADAVIGAGADVIFGQGDGSSFGMLQAVENGRSIKDGKLWFIDVIGDKTPIDKGNLLSSVVWNLEPIYSAMVDDLKAGTFGTRHFALSLADQSERLLHTAHIPDATWAELGALRQQIIDGAITVAPVFDAQKVRALMNDVAAK